MPIIFYKLKLVDKKTKKNTDMETTMTQSKRTILLFVVGIALVAAMLSAGTRPAAAQDATWRAEYWNNPSLGGTPILTRQENQINYNWWDGSPAPAIHPDNFSARWTRRVNFPAGTYRFAATMDDGMRVYLNGNRIIDEWNLSTTHTVSKDVYVPGGSNEIVVEYFDSGGQAVASFEWTLVGGSGGGWEGGGNGGDPGGAYPNWKGEYFSNTSLSGSPVVVRDDRYIDFNWGKGSPAYPAVPDDRFSARWTRNATYPAGQYKFVLTSDDGSRLYINGVQVINNFGSPPNLSPISADYWHPGGVMGLKVEYYEATGPARMKLDIIQVPGGSGGGDSRPPSDGCPAVSGFQAMVTVNSLFIRSEPSQSSNTLTSVNKCTLLVLTGFRTADNQWVSVGIPGTNRFDGWAQVQNLRLGIPITNLAIWTPTGGSGGGTGGSGGSGGSGGGPVG
jgi:hypothetical protein